MNTQLKFYDDKIPAPLLAEEIPENKFLDAGVVSMTNIDLLAVILNNQKGPDKSMALSRAIMNEKDNNLNDVARCSIHDLIKMGATKKQAITVSTIFELARRKLTDTAEVKTHIRSSKDIHERMQHLADLPYEEFHAILLNRQNKVLKTIKISQGGVNGTVIDVRLILKHALDNLASSIILCHNHPSGNTLPSESDKKITTKVAQGAKFMDMQVIDHIIIGGTSCYSFADEGEL